MPYGSKPSGALLLRYATNSASALMVVILSKDDCGLPRIDQDFNICGSTCLVIKSFTASSTMDVASCSSFLALMLVA